MRPDSSLAELTLSSSSTSRNVQQILWGRCRARSNLNLVAVMRAVWYVVCLPEWRRSASQVCRQVCLPEWRNGHSKDAGNS
eukprot:8783449-Pyramimonas_sp.AAC.1